MSNGNVYSKVLSALRSMRDFAESSAEACAQSSAPTNPIDRLHLQSAFQAEQMSAMRELHVSNNTNTVTGLANVFDSIQITIDTKVNAEAALRSIDAILTALPHLDIPDLPPPPLDYQPMLDALEGLYMIALEGQNASAIDCVALQVRFTAELQHVNDVLDEAQVPCNTVADLLAGCLGQVDTYQHSVQTSADIEAMIAEVRLAGASDL